MKIGIVRSRLTILVLGAAALGTTGCELIPGLINSPGTPDPTSTSAALTVTVDSVEGAIDGAALDPRGVEASGFRSGLSLQFDVVIPSQDATFTVTTAGAETSSENPYVGGPGDFGEGFPVDAGPPPPRLADAGPRPPGFEEEPTFEPSFDPNRALVMACSPLSGCREAFDFGLEIAQDAQGRTMVLDGSWPGDDRVHIELRYQELR
jgi:hypothetical protein